MKSTATGVMGILMFLAGSYLIYCAARNVSTGLIKPARGIHTFDRNKSPRTFWFSVLIHGIWGALLLLSGLRAVLHPAGK
jgi:hypothetical protein